MHESHIGISYQMICVVHHVRSHHLQFLRNFDDEMIVIWSWWELFDYFIYFIA